MKKIYPIKIRILSIIILSAFMFSQAALGFDYLRNIQIDESDKAGLAGAIGFVGTEEILYDQTINFLKQNKLDLTQQNIDKALEYVESVADRPVFSEATAVFNIENAAVSDKWTDNRYDLLAKQSGADGSVVFSYKGQSHKTEILEKLLGADTICFFGHGGRGHLWLAGGSGISADSTDMHNPAGISFEEMGERLTGNETLIFDCCFARPYSENLRSYRVQNDMQKMPCIISASHGRTTSSFIDDIVAVYGRRTDSLTMQDIFIAASRNKGISIFLPVDEEILSSFSTAKAGGQEFEGVLSTPAAGRRIVVITNTDRDIRRKLIDNSNGRISTKDEIRPVMVLGIDDVAAMLDTIKDYSEESDWVTVWMPGNADLARSIMQAVGIRGAGILELPDNPENWPDAIEQWV